MAALLPGKGNVVVITIPGQRNVDDRVAGVADALKNFPAIKLTKILDDKGDAHSAQEQIADLLQKKEDIDEHCLEAVAAGSSRGVAPSGMEGKVQTAFDDDLTGSIAVRLPRRFHKALRDELLWLKFSMISITMRCTNQRRRSSWRR
jgi:hypothetical protein